jgi:PAS domain S-box-containing protein
VESVLSAKHATPDALPFTAAFVPAKVSNSSASLCPSWIDDAAGKSSLPHCLLLTQGFPGSSKNIPGAKFRILPLLRYIGDGSGSTAAQWWAARTRCADGITKRIMDVQNPYHVGENAYPGEEQLARLLIDGVEDYAIFLLDPHGDILTWNTGAARLMGYSREEALGRHFSTFYLPDDQAADQPQQLLAAALEHSRAAHEGWHQRKDGSRFWAEAALTAVTDGDGNLVGFAKVTRDRSERRAYEQQRQHAEQELRALNAELEQRVRERTAELEERHRELETFTYSVSHDLKAPLRGIDGYSRLLQEDYSDCLDEEGRRFLATIRRATQQMSQLIEDLLAYSRLERRKLQVSPVSPAALVAAAGRSCWRTRLPKSC